MDRQRRRKGERRKKAKQEGKRKNGINMLKLFWNEMEQIVLFL